MRKFMVMVIGDSPEEQLGKFCDGANEPLPIEEECDCVGRVAKEETDKLLEGTIQVYRNIYWSIPQETRTVSWEDFIAPIEKHRSELYRQHNEYGKADPDCIICAGTGSSVEYGNPNEEFEFYSLCYSDLFPREAVKGSLRWGEIIADFLSTGTSKDRGYRCPDCKIVLPDGSLFCPHCGSAKIRYNYGILPVSAVISSGEWRERSQYGETWNYFVDTLISEIDDSAKITVAYCYY